VKLKDKVKKQEASEKIETVPNPANDYTNINEGYDRKKGTATMVGIA
jgi:hypothetical protein